MANATLGAHRPSQLPSQLPYDLQAAAAFATVMLAGLVLLLPASTYAQQQQQAPEVQTARALRPLFFTEEGQARGTDYVVTTAADVVAADGVVSLREALQAANTNQPVGDAPGGQLDSDVIRFDEALAGATLTFGSELAVTGDVFIDASPAGEGSGITFDAGGNGRVFNVNVTDRVGFTGAVGLIDAVLRAGQADGCGGAVYVGPGQQLGLENVSIFGSTASGSGGALCNDGGQVSLNNAVVSGNTAQGSGSGPPAQGGGGLYNLGGTLSVANAQVVGNTAAAGAGGGVFNVGGSFTADAVRIGGNTAWRSGGGVGSVSPGTVSFVNVAVEDNAATDPAAGRGGGLWVEGIRTTITVFGGSFAGNEAAAGGGVYSEGIFSAVAGTQFTGNAATGASGDDASDAGGGGLFNDGGTATLDGVSVTGNEGAYGGGLRSRGGSVSFVAGAISGNDAAVGGGLWTSGNLTVGDSTGGAGTVMRGNTASGDGSGRGGGGVYSEEGSISLAFATIEDNAAPGGSGGGVEIDGSNVAILRGSISGNTAGGDGGGIEARDSQMTVAKVRVDGNTAARGGSGRGGAIRIGGSGIATIFKSTLSGNTASSGGGLWASFDATTSVYLATVSGNAATDGDGGGVYGDGGELNGLVVLSTTVAQNTASGDGGGLYSTAGGRFFLGNAILAGNEAGGTGDDCEGPLISNDYNVVSDDAGCDFSGVTEHNVIGKDVALRALADNGGPTRTHRPAPGSPVLEAASTALDGDTTRTDQRGVARMGTRVDAGAVQLREEERPVALDAFTARVEDDDVVLTWQARARGGGIGFRIEQRRAAAGEADAGTWETAAVVEGDGGAEPGEAVSYDARLRDLAPGPYDLRLVQRGGEADGVALASSQTVEIGLGEAAFRLSRAYPNPVRPGRPATLELLARTAQDVTVTLYDALGRRVRDLYAGAVADFQPREVRVEAEALASGVYIVRVEGEDFTATRQVVVVR